MSNINNLLLHFPSSLFTENVLQKTQEMASPGSMPPELACPQTRSGLGRLRCANFSSPACTFKISRYAADYRYLASYEINAQGWKKRLWLEGVDWGRGCILKIFIAKGGTIFICNNFFWGGGGKVLKHNTFLKTHAPLWDVINDRSLKV